MDLEPVVTFKLPPELRLIPPVGIEPGHLVFVLAGHQPERVSCHRLGQFQVRPAGHGRGPARPDPGSPVYGPGSDRRTDRPPTVRSAPQVFPVPGRVRQRRIARRRGLRPEQGPVCPGTSPAKCPRAALDGDTIEGNGRLDRFGTKRQRAALAGDADEHEIGRDALVNIRARVIRSASASVIAVSATVPQPVASGLTVSRDPDHGQTPIMTAQALTPPGCIRHPAYETPAGSHSPPDRCRVAGRPPAAAMRVAPGYRPGKGGLEMGSHRAALLRKTGRIGGGCQSSGAETPNSQAGTA